MSRPEWGVFTNPRRARTRPRTWFAGLRRADLTFEWRSLDTTSRERAQQWLRSARCHGTDAHTETCGHCKPRMSETEALMKNYNEYQRDLPPWARGPG